MNEGGANLPVGYIGLLAAAQAYAQRQRRISLASLGGCAAGYFSDRRSRSALWSGAEGSIRLYAAYEALLRGRLPVLLVDQAVGEIFAEMKAIQQRVGKPVADLDLLIAATARAHELIIATLNVRHFALIADIEVEDWSLP